jgi:molybdopterin synthase sulfur carrier subunit
VSVPRIALFGPAREAAGGPGGHVSGATVEAVLVEASTLFGDGLVRILPTCRIWVNGEPADLSTPVGEEDEVAVLPPVSGG